LKIGTKIKEIRLQKNIKQIDLARMAEISNSYLSDIEKGRTEPSLKTLIKIAQALNIKDINIFLPNSYVKTEQPSAVNQ